MLTSTICFYQEAAVFWLKCDLCVCFCGSWIFFAEVSFKWLLRPSFLSVE